MALRLGFICVPSAISAWSTAEAQKSPGDYWNLSESMGQMGEESRIVLAFLVVLV